MRWRPLIVAALAFVALVSRPALSQEIVEFTAPFQSSQFPTSLVPGPDGKLYFGGGRISLDGTAAFLKPSPQNCDPADAYPATDVKTLAFDQDGNMWFTMDCPGPYFPPYPPSTTAFIGRMTSTGAVEGKVIDNQPADLILGPDGKIWFSGHGVSRIASDLVIETFQIRAPGIAVNGTIGLANGPDGNIWFTTGPTFGKVSIDGEVTHYDLPSTDRANGFITAGPDGGIWFPEDRFSGSFIARSTLSGQVTHYRLPSPQTGVGRITAGPDSNVWFTEPRLNKIGRITSNGTITELAIPTANSGATGITAGADGNIWFTEPSVGKIGRVNLNQRGNCIPTASAPCFGKSSPWEESGPPYPVVHSIAVSPDGSETLYVAASDPPTAQSGVFRSDDSGANWTLLAYTLPGDKALTVAIDPRDSRRLITTAFRQDGFSTRLYVSSNSGVTWQLGGDFPLACGGTFAFDVSDPSAVYVTLACSGEFLASQDSGLSWESRSSSLKLVRAGPEGGLYAVREGEGVVYSVDGGFHWAKLGAPPCPFFGESINALAVDPVGRLYAGTGHIRMIFVVCPGLFQSSDGGFTWAEISQGQIAPLYVTDIEIDGNELSHIYAASFHFGGGDVFESLDGGDHWEALHLPAPTSELVLSASGRVLFARTDRGLYRLSRRKTRVIPPR